MLKVEDMPLEEMKMFLRRIGYGHLGCAREGRPYVVPIHYAYDSTDLYFFTTLGMKTEYISANPEVCLQVEEVHDSWDWRSVMVNGKAEHLTNPEELEHAMQVLTAAHPTLVPAINATQIDAWGRANITAVYRIHVDTMDGRQTIPDVNTNSP